MRKLKKSFSKHHTGALAQPEIGNPLNAPISQPGILSPMPYLPIDGPGNLALEGIDGDAYTVANLEAVAPPTAP